MVCRAVSSCAIAFLLFSHSILFSVVIIGHRGASGYEPENTLRSFAKAIELGVDMIEFDVHVCASGELVIIHDDTVDATTNGSGLVAEKTLGELQALDAGAGEHIPTLREVLDLVNRRVKVDIELKGLGTAVLVAYLIDEYVQHNGWAYDDFFVTSFERDELEQFCAVCPQVQVSHIIHSFDGGDWREVLDHVITAIFVICSDEVTSEMVEYLHTRGICLYVYTVNEHAELERMRRLSVDGIFSDFPARARAVFANV